MSSFSSRPQCVNTLRPRQNERHFPDNIFKWIFLSEKVWISVNISLKFVPRGPINNIPTLVQIMAWRRPGDKPLSEPMMVKLPTLIWNWPLCVNMMVADTMAPNEGQTISNIDVTEASAPTHVIIIIIIIIIIISSSSSSSSSSILMTKSMYAVGNRADRITWVKITSANMMDIASIRTFYRKHSQFIVNTVAPIVGWCRFMGSIEVHQWPAVSG